MELDMIVSTISTVGFPIVMVILMFKWFTESYKREQDATREVISELKDAVNTMTTTVNTLINKQGTVRRTKNED